MDFLNDNDFYNDDSYSATSPSRQSYSSPSFIQLNLDPANASEIIMAEPQSSSVLISSNRPRCGENPQLTRLWRARDYYDIIGEHNEFAKCKVCSNNGKEKMFKHNKSTSNLSRHLRNEHNITDENPNGKVII
jgi:hypothetical protein